jgi:ferredoxin
VQDHVEVGFFTDPSVCIGCKACEVACKEWNQVPDDGFTWSGNSYDNTAILAHRLGGSAREIEIDAESLLTVKASFRSSSTARFSHDGSVVNSKQLDRSA